MSKRWLIILLIISLAFNLAVMGVFIFTTATGRPPFPPPQRGRGMMGDVREGKKPGQNKWVADCMKQGMQGCQPKRDSFQVERLQFIQKLRAADFNEASARAALEKSLQAHSKMERALGENLIVMRKKMTAEQAKLFFDKRFEHKSPNRDNFRNKHKQENRRTQ